MVKKEFQLYKGLQRPLVFKMFKGRYIYWALGTLVGGVMAGVFFGALISSAGGLVAMLLFSFPLLIYTLNKQKHGLYDKRKDNAIFIITPKHHHKKQEIDENQKEI